MVQHLKLLKLELNYKHKNLRIAAYNKGLLTQLLQA